MARVSSLYRFVEFFLFCLSGILVSYFWGWYETYFWGGKLVVTTCDVQVQLMLRLITGSTSLWRSMPECRAVWNQWSSSQLAGWLIDVCGGEYIAEKASWFKSVLIFQGISIKPVVNALKVKKEGDNDPKMTEKIQESVSINTIFFPFISWLPSLLSFGGQKPL